MTDRRRQNLFKDIIVPVSVSVVTGVAAAFVSSQMAIKVLETKVQYIESDIKTVRQLAASVSAANMELNRRGAWMDAIELRVSRNERDIYELNKLN
ncbi:hypothetical protein [Aestuariibacter sp. A3R04]|uniref:hypothetical protein n=1 Tax=Aestuariibacter sp. A3R04 TaxID=2841571 RepID=UPI001C0A1AB7|nr:hypothetical protein [Aestuariibacter sp. A3R04]MBU3022884.1 hypothetical protein [Aestuariibacter sp. A3R04]